MFQLQITVHTIEGLERLLACLKHSADPDVVKDVTNQISYHSPGGLSDDESPAKKYFPNTHNTAGEPVSDPRTAAAEKPKNPRGRPRRQVAEPLNESAAPATLENALAEAPNAGSAEADAPAQQTHTLDDVREALMGVQNKTPGDMTACLAILEKFGAKRVSEVKPEDFGQFIAACKAA